MDVIQTILLTDIVDSTLICSRVGDEVMRSVWTAHDRAARFLIRKWRGREVARSDGLLVIFEAADDAVAFSDEYHRALAVLPTPLRARVGMHTGPFQLRENAAEERSSGAPVFEIDGLALPVAARVMSVALGEQTLITYATKTSLSACQARLQSHGHWLFKGVNQPLELFEVGRAEHPSQPPIDAEKGYRVVQHGDGWLPSREIPNNLTEARDSFVGRGSVLQRISDDFDKGARLISLVGTGGIGKTRLAQKFASAYRGDHPGGVWFCDLSRGTTEDDIVHLVAATLGLSALARDLNDRIGVAIAGRGRCLVVLDNFEQLAAHAEATIGHWLDRAPDAHYLVTTRELLQLAGEVSIVVPGLKQEEAVELFHQRARTGGAMLPASTVDPADVVSLIDLLDGLPLAIELAAARAAVMGPREMIPRMRERFNVLSSKRGRHTRHVTLRATLDWSWNLLTEVERSTLSQLSVFEAGFTLQAFESVVLIDSPGTSSWPIDVLHSLVSKSLVKVTGASRFDLLNSTREYSAEKLAVTVDLLATANQRHWEYFAKFDEEAAGGDRGSELYNFCAACHRAAGSDLSQAITCLANAWSILRLIGPFSLALELVRALEGYGLMSDHQQALVDRVAGGAFKGLGDVDRARRRYESSLAYWMAASDHEMSAQMLTLLGDVELSAGQLSKGRSYLARAIGLGRTAGNPTTLIRALNSAGTAELNRSRFDDAERLYAEALVLAETIGATRWRGGLHGNLGTIAQSRGRLADARLHYEVGLRIAEEVGDKQWEGNTRCNLGLLLHLLGDNIGARRELDVALKLARHLGHRRLEATTACNLGIILAQTGDRQTAVPLLTEAVTRALEMSDPRLEGQFLGYLGLLFAELGQSSKVPSTFARAHAALGESGDHASLGLLHCQHATAAALLGDQRTRDSHLKRAEQELSNIRFVIESELSLALARARAS